MARVLVLAVHPDDETLGCGGTLLKHKSVGDQLHWCIATTTRGVSGFSAEFADAREAEIARVRSSYDFETVDYLGLPSAQVDNVPFNDIVAKLSSAVKRVGPEILYLPYLHDVHSDHKIVAQAAMICTKSFRFPTVKRVLMMEALSETEYAGGSGGPTFAPNFFVDVSAFAARKLEIMSTYQSELGEHPFPRSCLAINSLGTLRGSMCGAVHAEAFQLLKHIW